jgi:hypothetical protein
MYVNQETQMIDRLAQQSWLLHDAMKTINIIEGQCELSTTTSSSDENMSWPVERLPVTSRWFMTKAMIPSQRDVQKTKKNFPAQAP